ncbi:ribonuclease J [Candidatus Uhrbacteria bacterium]|nr:ribonuclease J [Candidatus Uhrbacteria bacterium]
MAEQIQTMSVTPVRGNPRTPRRSGRRSGQRPTRGPMRGRPRPASAQGFGASRPPSQQRAVPDQPARFTEGERRLRVTPLGGVGEFGRNMMLFEYGNDMVVIDMGLMFPLDSMPGVDYVLPDITYAKKNRHKIRGVLITHGHLDHTGAIPYFIRDLGMPTVYGTKLTIGMIRDRLDEFNLTRHVRLSEVDPDDTLQLGVFTVTFFRVNHNIPDSIGIALHTPVGTVIHTGDWKFDHTPQDQRPTEFGKLARLGMDGVLLLCSDSTNAERPGYCLSEREIEQNLRLLFSKASGRIIIATFSSLVSRIQQIVTAAAELDRKVAISGMSMEKVLTTSIKLGFLKVPRGTVIKIDEISKYPDNRIVIISTGSQGQETSALGRMSRGEHRHVKIQKGDTIILSSSPIPGNERAVTNLMNNLFLLGADVVYNKLFDVHASGHAYREEMKLMLGLVRPRYFMPIHGERYMLVRHAEIARQMGWSDKSIFIMGNGESIEMNHAGVARLSPQKIDIDYIMVDGLGVGDVGNVVIRDRQVLAQDGMVVIVAPVDKNGKLAVEPDVISRGFVYVKGSEHLMGEVKSIVIRILESQNLADIELWAPVRNRIRDDVGALLFKKTEKRPMVLPVMIKV